jgi:hypothetical protein
MDSCPAYLMSCGVEKSEVKGIIEALKMDVIIQYSRPPVLQYSHNDFGEIKASNVSFQYEFESVEEKYNWRDWFCQELQAVGTLAGYQPMENYQFGSRLYYGFTVRKLRESSSCWSRQVDALASNPSQESDSAISDAVAEVAGFIYSLGLSVTMAHVSPEFSIRCSLRDGFRLAYKRLAVRPGQPRTIRRDQILGTLGTLWLSLPNSWASNLPRNALAIGNSRGSVVSAAIVTEGLSDCHSLSVSHGAAAWSGLALAMTYVAN